MRNRLAVLLITGLLVSTTLFPSALGAFQELELQGATDALWGAGRDTVDRVFWRSGFGASVLGGPAFAGNVTAYDALTADLQARSGGQLPVGARPVFVEFSLLPDAAYANASVNASDYSTQRWNLTNASMEAGAWSLGAGAAAQAAWANYFLRTNHWPVNGTQDPSAPLVGASDADGLLGLLLVQGLQDRVNATVAFGAYNGTALTSFNLTDPALNDDNASNGWQLVPGAFLVNLSADAEPLFQGFDLADGATTVGGQGALILGLAEVVRLSDPAGARGALFQGTPYGGTLHASARALLLSAVNNTVARHWDAAAFAFADPGALSVSTGDLALFVRALAVAESVLDAEGRATVTPVRERAYGALQALGDANGVFASSYAVVNGTVVPDASSATLWGQAAALEASFAAFELTGLKEHYDDAFLAAAGLESRLFSTGSYHAEAPEPALTTFKASAVAATLGALRDLAKTGEEPLAIYRIVNATMWLFTAPNLTLSGANAPPVIGASFVWNATSLSYETRARDFESAGGLFAAYEWLTVGPEFYAKVGGGVSVTERAALLLHNATAAQVGGAVDALDQQVAALGAQIAALQASFDALNASVSNITEQLNLSQENETISAQRIADLQANVTSLRTQLNYTVENLTKAQSKADEAAANYTEVQSRFMNVTNNLTIALSNASALAGDLNVTQNKLDDAFTAMESTNRTLDERNRALTGAQQGVAAAAAIGLVAGMGLMFVIQRFVLTPRPPGAKGEGEGKPSKGKGGEQADEDDD